jgi:hypothetical protein
MVALLCFFLTLFASSFRSKSRLEAENGALRHQLTVLRRKVRGRVQLTNDDRLFLIQLYRWFPVILKAITIVRPQTLVRWHRAGFRRYWRWKSRSLGGRPQIDADRAGPADPLLLAIRAREGESRAPPAERPRRRCDRPASKRSATHLSSTVLQIMVGSRYSFNSVPGGMSIGDQENPLGPKRSSQVHEKLLELHMLQMIGKM